MAPSSRPKRVTDQHGHAVGDRVLQAIAARLLLAVPGYAVGRLGGDEFLVVAGGADRSQAESTAERPRRVLDEPVTVDGNDFATTMSVGIAHVDGPGAHDPESLLASADRSMYEDKDGRRPAALADD